jgi:thiamine transporter ThiT
MKKKYSVRQLTAAAMFLALGQVLPFITGQIPQIGAMLSPMHLPVLLCGLICGPLCGGIVGLICPLLRSVLFGMPMMYPAAIAMAFELAAYGLISGWLYEHASAKEIRTVYTSLIAAMLAGRAVWGLAELLLLGLNGKPFTFQMFLAGAFINAIPAIILQLTLIPAVMSALDHAGILRFRTAVQA